MLAISLSTLDSMGDLELPELVQWTWLQIEVGGYHPLSGWEVYQAQNVIINWAFLLGESYACFSIMETYHPHRLCQSTTFTL